MDYRLKKLVLTPLIDVAYQGEAGLREMVLKAEDVLKNHKYIEVSKLIEEIKFHLAKDDGLVVYGLEEIKRAVEMGAVDSLIVYDDGDPKLESLAQEAEKFGTKVFLVGDEVPEAEWVKKTFGGAIGKLRFRIS